jgi:isoquinoline 1-oxidoreductase beta subunit
MKILSPFQKKRKTVNIEPEVFSATRRDFLKVGGILSGGLMLGVSFWSCNDKGKKLVILAPNVYLRITDDGQVTIVSHRVEMGQGIRTGLPVVLADELGADWSKVKIVQGEGDEKKYGNQNTDGSFSVRMFYTPMREAGAIAKLLLMQAAAQQWGVPVNECDTANSQVIHKGSGKKLDFGALVEAAAKLPIPTAKDVQLKDPGQFNMIGKATPIVDLHDIVTGKAVFGADAEVAGLKVAVIKRSPVVGGSVKSVNDAKALAVPGVLKVIQIKGAGLPATLRKPLAGVAVIAENTWAAIKGRELLEVEWELGPNADYDSDVQIAELTKAMMKDGTVRRKRGDFSAAKAKAAKVIDHTYIAPYLAHATLETPNATAVMKDGMCEIWAPTQNPQGAKDAVVEALGVAADKVRVNVTLVGGGFGRKSKPDYVVEAALLAQASGLPIRVQWTREDDIHHDYYHAMSVQRIVATIDHNNKLSGWNHHIANPSIGATEDTKTLQPADGELGLGASDFPYDVPAIRLETHDAPAHLRIGWLRSVRNIPQVFAIGTMLDEVAEARGMDPVANALDLLGEDRSLTFSPEMVNGTYPNYGEKIEDFPWEVSRMKGVIKRVAEESGWGKKTLPAGTGMGFAAHKSFLTYVACVVQVQVDAENKVTIQRVDYAVDCGVAVNTDRVRSQFEGGAQFAASLALKSAITVKNGQVVQNNFDGYQLIRMTESPKEIHVHIVESNAKPTGVGEPPVPPFTPALCNAIFAVTGKRIHHLPIDLKA